MFMTTKVLNLYKENYFVFILQEGDFFFYSEHFYFFPLLDS